MWSDHILYVRIYNSFGQLPNSQNVTQMWLKTSDHRRTNEIGHWVCIIGNFSKCVCHLKKKNKWKSFVCFRSKWQRKNLCVCVSKTCFAFMSAQISIDLVVLLMPKAAPAIQYERFDFAFLWIVIVEPFPGKSINSGSLQCVSNVIIPTRTFRCVFSSEHKSFWK